MKKLILILALILSQTAFLVGQTCVVCDQTPLGFGASIIGNASSADGTGSIAIGTNAHTLSNATSSLAIGTMVKTIAGKSIVIGCGSGLTTMLTNSIQESLMIGFNSSKPTVFVSRSDYEKTGRVGIGNVIDQFGVLTPLAKLHLRADEGEEATFFIEPNNWPGGDFANLFLGNFYHGITADTNQGLHFLSQKDYLFASGNMGLGVEEPRAKLHVDGDILFENPANGLILKSEDGQCWKVTANNDGTMVSTSVDCNSLSGVQPAKEPEYIPLYFYPNPTSGYMVIENPENSKGLVAKFRTIDGTLLMTGKLKGGENKFDLNFVNDGMLLITVCDQKGNVISSEKVVVSN